MPREAHALERRWITDPRATLIALAIVLVAALVVRNAIVVGLAMGGLAGFSLSGSP
jgi:hypothetical protein